ncbi:MAG: hypothetical protein QXO75_01515 [Nitrososphaerota archaeon]
MRSDLDLLPLRERKQSTIRGSVSISLIFLILRLSIRWIVSESELNRKYFGDKILFELEKMQIMGIDRKMIEREPRKRKTYWNLSIQLNVPKYVEPMLMFCNIDIFLLTKRPLLFPDTS